MDAEDAAAGADPLLRVEDLRVEFPTEDGVVHAVDGIGYELQAGRTLGIVGESGSGKTVSALTAMGLHRRRTRASRAGSDFDGRDLLALGNAGAARDCAATSSR